MRSHRKNNKKVRSSNSKRPRITAILRSSFLTPTERKAWLLKQPALIPKWLSTTCRWVTTSTKMLRSTDLNANCPNMEVQTSQLLMSASRQLSLNTWVVMGSTSTCARLLSASHLTRTRDFTWSGSLTSRNLSPCEQWTIIPSTFKQLLRLLNEERVRESSLRVNRTLTVDSSHNSKSNIINSFC